MRWVRAHDLAGRVLALPSQTPGLRQRYGLSREELEREAWAIEPSGRRYAGAAAMNRVLSDLRGPWPPVAALYRLPLIGWLEDWAYRWVADHRSWLSRLWGTTPECERPEVECADDPGP